MTLEALSGLMQLMLYAAAHAARQCEAYSIVCINTAIERLQRSL